MARIDTDVRHLFDNLRYGPTPADGFMATMEKPTEGFNPFRIGKNIEVRFVGSPHDFLPNLAGHAAGGWANSIGQIVWINQQTDAVGIIALHSAYRAPWSEIASGAWQGVGGIMAFDDRSFAEAVLMVRDKAYAMTPKWRFIDLNLEAIGHPSRSDLGGMKSILLHGSSAEEKVNAAVDHAVVTRKLGIYVAGPDQNFGPAWSRLFAGHAPINFIGADTAHPKYQGISPSPYTAEGVFAGMRVAMTELLGGDIKTHPVFVQGYGGVGTTVVHNIINNGMSLAGLSDVVLKALLKAKKDGVPGKLILDVSPLHRRIAEGDASAAEELSKRTAAAQRHGILVANGLTEALELVPETKVLSPNADAHPITMAVVERLDAKNIHIIAGGANCMAGLDEHESPDPVLRELARRKIFLPNDSRLNELGATVCAKDILNLNEPGIQRMITSVGEGTRPEIEAHRRGEIPQHYSDQVAFDAHNRALDEGRAIGGRHETVKPAGATELRASVGVPTFEDVAFLRRGAAAWNEAYRPTYDHLASTNHAAASHAGMAVFMLAKAGIASATSEVSFGSAVVQSVIGLGGFLALDKGFARLLPRRFALLAPVLAAAGMALATDTRIREDAAAGHYGRAAFRTAAHGVTGGLLFAKGAELAGSVARSCFGSRLGAGAATAFASSLFGLAGGDAAATLGHHYADALAA